MTRYIDADALIGALHNHAFLEGDDRSICYNIIQKQPTIDAEPVRHGKWELAEDGWYCSACELYPPFDCDPEEKGIPYCPYCGARMDDE